MYDVQIHAAVSAWVSAFGSALDSGDSAKLESLFCNPAYFRDNGALTWDYRQFHGRENVIAMLLSLAEEARPRNFRIAENWPAPSISEPDDAATIEAFVDFETKSGSALLVLNGVPDAEGAGIKVSAIFTKIEALNTNEKRPAHPRGRGYEPSFPGQTWKQHRDSARQYSAGEPDVVIVGAGQAGLAVAAYLRSFDVDVLNIDRYEKVGDSWGKRYDSLYLHNPVEMNAFPFLPFPPHYPEYLPKDVVSDWLDLYARYMDLNVWTSTEFVSGQYDAAKERWNALVRGPDGAERELHPQHIVLATGGIGGKPSMPKLPGLDKFAGKVIHSSQFTRASDYGIKKAIIVGVATSAHDIARALQQNGVEVTMLQRGEVVVNNVETANLAYAQYMDTEIPTKVVDARFAMGMINPLRERASKAYHEMAKNIDRDLLTRLKDAGLRLGDGVNGQGWLDLFFRTGGGYYLNTGTSELIADGKIKVEQFNRVDDFVAEGVKLDDGTIVEAGLVVLATGYQSRKTEVVDFFGSDVAAQIGEVARLDAEGEWANLWGQTAQRGLWFNGGGINQMRPNSACLALLIKADLDGLIPEHRRRDYSSTVDQLVG